ncbi:hypothetical protein [Streptomyces sp. NPDC127112]|uniref:hypothetical protein n=1 Tax=Streptomyces sp. NPDC127112 TaxID=3345364 RepID=UPI00363A9263
MAGSREERALQGCEAGEAPERRWSDIKALVGTTTARAWRLYLAGASLAFSERSTTRCP